MESTMSSRSSTSITHSVFERLRGELLSGGIRPGQKLKIQELVEQLGANQGAVREALSRLVSEGLVTAEPQKGFRARPITRAELLDLTYVRIGIEGQCLKRAIALGDLRWEASLMAIYHELSKMPEKTHDAGAHGAQVRMAEPWSQTHFRFHETLASACDSPWLLRLRAQLFAQADRYRRLSIPLQRAHRNLDAEHRELVEAAIARDADRACELIAEHFRKTTETLLGALDFDDDPPR